MELAPGGYGMGFLPGVQFLLEEEAQIPLFWRAAPLGRGLTLLPLATSPSCSTPGLDLDGHLL